MTNLATRLYRAIRPPTARPIAPVIAVNAAPAESATKPPKAGRVISPRQRDHTNIFSGDLTPDRVKQILAATIYGNAEQINAAFDRMIERDAHIQCEYEKRLLAVTGLAWDVVSMSQIREGDLSDSEARLADEIASFVRKSLTMIRVTGHNIVGTQPIEAGLGHLMDAVGRGLSCVEQEWGEATVRLPGGEKTIATRMPIRWHCLASSRFLFDSQEPWRLRVRRDDSDFEGLALDEQPPGKFILHAPRSVGGNPFRGGLHVPALMMFYGKTYGWKWFMSAMELFGQPLLIAKYPPNATPAEIEAILQVLEDIGNSARGAFSANTAFEAISTGFTSSGTQSIYERMIKLADAAVSKNYVGVTLLTEVGEGGGNRALGDNMQEVREDLRDKDILGEGATISEQYIRTLVAASPYAAQGGLELLPVFRREIDEPADDRADMELLDKAVNRFKNVKVPKRHLHERFGFPTTEDEAALDEPLEGAGGIDPFGLGGATDELATENRRAIRKTCNRALDRILSRRSPLASIGPWLIGAILASQSVTERVVDAFDVALAPFNNVALPAVATSLPAEMVAALTEAFEAVGAGDSHADMVELNRQLLLATRLHGERTTQVKVERARSRNARTINAESIDFERLPFVEAIESLRDRVGLDPETFIQLEADARSRAFRVAGVWDMDLLAVLHTNLVRTITNGETVRDFRLRVLPQMADRAGWTGENPWHSNVVFYQNFAMAHAAGRFRQYDDLEISYWRFTAHGDTCEICEPFVGKVYRTTDTRYVPPLHFFCDCIDEVVFQEELRDDELRDSRTSPENPALAKYLSQPSAFKFDVRQYAALEPIRIDKYPNEFQSAFRRLAEARGWEVAA